MLLRKASELDKWAIGEALAELYEYSKQYDWAVKVNYDLAFVNVMDAIHLGCGYVADGYLIMVDTVTPWYTSNPVLQEWLVIKIEDGGHISAVPLAVKQIAIERGCSLAITADSSPVSIVASAYTDAGFKRLTQSFFTKV